MRATKQAVKLSWNELSAVRVPHGDRVHRARVACAQQTLALHRLRSNERHHGVLVQSETLGRFLHAVPEPHALVAIDHDPQSGHDSLIEPAHMPSSPSSARAVSITVGVISAMPRSRA